MNGRLNLCIIEYLSAINDKIIEKIMVHVKIARHPHSRETGNAPRCRYAYQQ